MPAFIDKGPDIPERLLQAHEEGRVVFFCGAGISAYPARLPMFYQLVTELYNKLGDKPNAIQQTAIDTGQLDTAIGLLEAGITGGRLKVRKTMAGLLKYDPTIKNFTDTHESLLQLSRNRDGKSRLITTNFDRLFEHVIADKSLKVTRYEAPLLPVPKNKWDGLIYLHGLLHEKPSDSELERLVLSSGDFGLAYLTERWAARFISELLRTFNVCFIGYSLNDPVLRYMMDAHAADRLLGESPVEMFAFGNFKKGTKEQCEAEWGAKNVTPILYKNHSNHYYLRKTLNEWAETYQNGERGKEMIVAVHAGTPPIAPSRLDYITGRVLWALTDELAAKHFADLNPVPPLKWLDPLSESLFDVSDLPRFGVTPDVKKDKTLQFSVIHRPTPYKLAPAMQLVGHGNDFGELDVVMWHLARWLTRHLGDPDLIYWVINNGGKLQERFVWLIRSRITKIEKLEADGNISELEMIKAEAPKAIPSSSMRILWQLISSDYLYHFNIRYDIYEWVQKIISNGLTPSLRLELHEIMKPRLKLRRSFRIDEDSPSNNEILSIENIVEGKVVLSCESVRTALYGPSLNARFTQHLPTLLGSFSSILTDSMDLLRELGLASEKSDSSYIHQPSISDHEQNQHFEDWTVLVDLVRDAWIETARIAPNKALNVAESWQFISYPIFRRLSFYAAANSEVISTRKALSWLLADDCRWLWESETLRETIRLLVSLASRIENTALTQIETAILNGPQRGMFPEDISQDDWSRYADMSIWLRLQKMKFAGAVFSLEGNSKLNELSEMYPHLSLSSDERDEFPFWMGSGDENVEFTPIPRRRREIVAWLQDNPSSDYWKTDDWRVQCTKNFPAVTTALFELSRREEWPIDRWREALQEWSRDSEGIGRSWRYIAQIIVVAPDSVFQELSNSLGWWVQEVAKTFVGQEDTFFSIIRRLLEIERNHELEDTDDSVSQALNHPVGYGTQALLDWWYRQQPQDSEGLDESVKPFFTKICDIGIEIFRLGRVLLASRVITFFRVDEEWTKQYLLPLFDWENIEIEALSAWKGFLWSPRLYRPFLKEIKHPLLETALHYELLGRHASQYASFLAFVALDPSDIFTDSQLIKATHSLPSDGLQDTAKALVRALEGSKENIEYWNNRLHPYLQKIWPRSRTLRTTPISDSLSRLCVAAGDAFPEALKELTDWLQPIEYPDFLIRRVNNAGYCKRFPTEALAFLNAVIGPDCRRLPKELKQCLDDTIHNKGDLSDDPRYVRLVELSRRRGTQH